MHRIIFILFMFFSLNSIAQNEFSFQDTVFSIGSIHKLDIRFNENTYELLEDSKPSVDSIYFFLGDNWDVCLRIWYVAKPEDTPLVFASSLDYSRALAIKEYILNKGLEQERIDIFRNNTPIFFFDKEITDGESYSEDESYGLHMMIINRVK